jgi:hypothetical protein
MIIGMNELMAQTEDVHTYLDKDMRIKIWGVVDSGQKGLPFVRAKVIKFEKIK